MGDITILSTLITSLDLPVERVLLAAIEEDLDEVLVIGFTNNGDFYFAANKASGADTLWLLKLAEHKLLRIGNLEDV